MERAFIPTSGQIPPTSGSSECLKLRPSRGIYYLKELYIHTQSERIASWQARVVCNVRVKELNTFLEPHGLFLPSTTSSVNPTVAGLVATASHVSVEFLQ